MAPYQPERLIHNMSSAHYAVKPASDRLVEIQLSTTDRSYLGKNTADLSITDKYK